MSRKLLPHFFLLLSALAACSSPTGILTHEEPKQAPDDGHVTPDESGSTQAGNPGNDPTTSTQAGNPALNPRNLALKTTVIQDNLAPSDSEENAAVPMTGYSLKNELTWTPPEAREGVACMLDRKMGALGIYGEVAALQTAAGEITDFSPYGGTYYYRIRCTDTAGRTGISNEVKTDYAPFCDGGEKYLSERFWDEGADGDRRRGADVRADARYAGHGHAGL